MNTKVRFDVDRLKLDMAARGWVARDLARRARLSDVTMHRVLNGQRHNPRTWARLAKALGKETRRYVVQTPEAVVA